MHLVTVIENFVSNCAVDRRKWNLLRNDVLDFNLYTSHISIRIIWLQFVFMFTNDIEISSEFRIFYSMYQLQIYNFICGKNMPHISIKTWFYKIVDIDIQEGVADRCFRFYLFIPRNCNNKITSKPSLKPPGKSTKNFRYMSPAHPT